MSASNSITFKGKLVGNFNSVIEVHRFTVEPELAYNFPHLKGKLALVFLQLAGKEFRIFWRDEENDEVVIANDEELKIALNEITSDVKTIYIRLVDGDDNVNTGPDASEFVHLGVVCDECDGEVRGFRYKCLECRDYDLCESCERKRVHSYHIMIRITSCISSKICHKYWKRMSSHAAQMGRESGKRGCPFLAKQDCSDCHGEKKKKHIKCHPKDIGKHDHGIHKRQRRNRKLGECAASVVNLLKLSEPYVNPSGPENQETSQNTSGEQLSTTKLLGALAGNTCAMIQPLLNIIHQQLDPNSQNGAHCSRNDSAPRSTPQDEKMQADSEVNEGAADEFEKMSQAFAKQSISQEDANSSSDTGVSDSAKKQSGDEKNGSGEKVKPSEVADDIPSDPVVCRALIQMLTMGFTNEGGRLAQLLREKKGDIGEVLEILQSEKK